MMGRFLPVLIAILSGLWLILLLTAGVFGMAAGDDSITFVGLIGTDYEFFSVDVTTGVLHNLTRSPAQDVSFSWSPDGSEIVFVRRTATSELYRMDASGRKLRLLDDKQIPIFPQWSPDGVWVAFLGNRASGLPDAFVIPAAGGTPRNLTDTAEISEGDIAWSPDSTSIALTSYTSGRHILRVNVRDGTRQKLIDNATLPAWSPDGRWIAFIRLTDNAPAVWLKALADGRETRLDTGPGMVASSQPVWSPQGQLLALLKTPESRRGEERIIYLMNTDTGEGRFAAFLPEYVSQIAWSPDGTRLAALTGTAIYLLDVASGMLRQVIDTGFPIRMAAWKAR